MAVCLTASQPMAAGIGSNRLRNTELDKWKRMEGCFLLLIKQLNTHL